jgi:hypothetical protein
VSTIKQRAPEGDDALVVTVERTRELPGNPCREKVYELVKDGALESYLDGRRRWITTRSIRAHVERMLAASREYTRARYPGQQERTP